MSRLQRIQLIELILVVGFFCSLAYHYELAAVCNVGFPWNTFLWDPTVQFNDVLGFLPWSNYPYDHANSGCVYPPFFLMVLHVLLRNHSASQVLEFYMGTAFAGSLAIAFSYLKGDSWFESARRAVVFTVFTLPFLFALDRGNLEIWQYFDMAAVIYFLSKNNDKAAGLLQAIGMDLKPFAVVYLPVFIAQRKWKSLIVSCLLAGLMMLGSVFYFHRTIPQFLSDYKCAANNCSLQNANGDRQFGYSDNLFSVAKLVAAYTVDHYTTQYVQTMLRYYGYLSIALSILVALYVIFIDREFWRQILVCTAAIILLPPISVDYRVIEMLIPLFLFINKTERSAMDLAFCLLFALILIPKGYVHFEPAFVFEQVVVNPVALLALTIMTIIQGFQDFGRRGQRTLKAI